MLREGTRPSVVGGENVPLRVRTDVPGGCCTVSVADVDAPTVQVTIGVTQGALTKSAEQVLSDDTILGNQAIVAMNLNASVSSVIVYTSPGPKSP